MIFTENVPKCYFVGIVVIKEDNVYKGLHYKAAFV